jgi:hypothetical protein
MRQRIEMCRRLARNISDQQTSQMLREMADQGEIDLQKLLAEREECAQLEAEKKQGKAHEEAAPLTPPPASPPTAS